MATRVSWGFADITISFDMETPQGASGRGGHVGWQGERARSVGVAENHTMCKPRRAAQAAAAPQASDSSYEAELAILEEAAMLKSADREG
jgi:hypothetical protein